MSTVKRNTKPAKNAGAPKLKGVDKPVKSPKQQTTARRKPAAPKDVVFSIPSGGGIWYKIRQRDIIVYDEELGYNRTIRYCPAEKSIFEDEQSDNARREQIVFREGTLKVDYKKPALLEYLRIHPDNIANGGNLFIEVNNEVSAEEALEREFAMHDAISMIKGGDMDTLLPVALSYGISAELSDLEIKRALLQQAKANPEGFIQAMDSPVVKLKAMVITAIDFEILKRTKDGMYWKDSNSLIAPTPMGQDTLDSFTRFLMTDKGTPVRDELERQVDEI